MTLTFILIAGLAVWFIILWSLVISLMSMLSGWRSLSRMYPAPVPGDSGQKRIFSMCSIRLGFISYNNIAYITFTDTGIILKVMKIFSIMHRPIFIPYAKITGAAKGKTFFTYTGFNLDGRKIYVYSRAGEELFSRLSSQ
jgi:hypothetical protein